MQFKFEQDIDRLMIRTPYQHIGKESWHRDESKYAKKGQNYIWWFGEFRRFPPYYLFCPGTHLEEDTKLKKKGFARIKKEDMEGTRP